MKNDAMRELEDATPDPDRRDGALQRILERVYGSGIEDGADLSEGELLILKSLSHGLTTEQAAKLAGVSYNTARDRMNKVRRVLRAKNATHAVANAIRQGLIP